MRRFIFLTLLACLVNPPMVHARLFWHSYGAVVPGECGEGCTWNANQDYFVPRHCDSCRYDLFSPCKSSCTISPACRKLHPVYPGYCSPYGACRTVWRNYVYHVHCGCGHGSNLAGTGFGWSGFGCEVEMEGAIPNVEPNRFEVLGAIPVDSDQFLASLTAQGVGLESPQSLPNRSESHRQFGQPLPEIQTPFQPPLPTLPGVE